MSSPRLCTRKPRRQLRACVLEKCGNADLVNQYKSFAKHIKRERNTRAEGRIDDNARGALIRMNSRVNAK